MCLEEPHVIKAEGAWRSAQVYLGADGALWTRGERN